MLLAPSNFVRFLQNELYCFFHSTRLVRSSLWTRESVPNEFTFNFFLSSVTQDDKQIQKFFFMSLHFLLKRITVTKLTIKKHPIKNKISIPNTKSMGEKMSLQFSKNTLTCKYGMPAFVITACYIHFHTLLKLAIMMNM
jgi:hypothetical protein